MSQCRSTMRAARACAVALAFLAILGSGCVERRVIIRTNPPGALAYVDDNEVGLTPVAISPIYYGNRKIRLVKDGCETLTIIQSMPPPWYEIPPLDFFSENLVPGNIHDERTFDYQLHPQAVVPQEALLGRADNLRRGTQTMTGVTAPGYRYNQPVAGQSPVPAPGTPGGPPIGGQPLYQLPPGSPGAAAPIGPIYNPPPAAAPLGPAGGPIYQAPPSLPQASPAGPSNVGSQPNYPLP
jgi:hypothetical protein